MQELKCLNCGSPLEKSGDTYICKYCGSEYSDDEISNVINNYGTANIVINNIKSDKASVEDYLSSSFTVSLLISASLLRINTAYSSLIFARSVSFATALAFSR